MNKVLMPFINTKLIFLWLLLPLIFSCQQGSEDSISETEVVYYDYYSLAPSFTTPANDTVETYRVCYDMQQKQIRWQKKNEYPIPYHYTNLNSSPGSLLYSNSFSVSGYLIKIFPSTDNALLGRPMTGIYFQKIDKTTGNTIVSNRIISPSEFDASSAYSISEVISDGSRYYFACNNGFVYCFDGNGILVWKKGGYPPGNSWVNYGGYSFIYFDENKLYIPSIDNSGIFPAGTIFLNCLNPANGERLWYNFGVNFINGRQIAFGKNHLAVFNNNGQSGILRKSDGFEIAVNAGLGSSSNVVMPIGMTDSTHIVYFNRDGDIGFIDTDHPGSTRYIDITKGIDENFIKYKNRVYSIVAGYPYSTMSFTCIDPNSGIVWNKDLNIILSPTGHNFYYNYFINNDKLFVLSSYHFDNNTLVGNPPSQNRIVLTISRIDLNSGNFITQSTGLPAGLTNLNRIYNMIIE